MSLNFEINKSPTPGYVIDLSGDKPSCLPMGIDKGDLVDITRLSDTWRRYASKTQPGVVYDGAIYAKLAQQQSGE